MEELIGFNYCFWINLPNLGDTLTKTRQVSNNNNLLFSIQDTKMVLRKVGECTVHSEK